MGTSPVYDEIGLGYAVTRRPDPRIARAIDAALGDARSVVNVGAGAGSYEPSHLRVTAVEPSPAMIRQRAPGAAPVVQRRRRAPPVCGRLLRRRPRRPHPAPLDGSRGGSRRARPRGAPPRGHPHLGPVLSGSLLAHDRVPARDRSTSTSRASRGCRTSLGASRRWTRIRCSCLTIAWTAFSAPSGAGPRPISIPACAGAYPRFAQLPSAALDEGLARLAADLDDGRWDARFGHLRDPGQCGPRLPAPRRRAQALITGRPSTASLARAESRALRRAPCRHTS